MSGSVRGADSTALSIELHDETVVVFRCSRKTRWLNGAKPIKPSSLREGDLVQVEAARALDGALDAVIVRLQHARDADLPAPRK